MRLPPTSFEYTFDHIAEIVEKFTDEVGLRALFVCCAGLRRPRRHAAGGAPTGAGRVSRSCRTRSVTRTASVRCGKRGARSGPTERAHEASAARNFFSPAATRQRHVGKSPEPDRYDPDLWTDELAFLSRPARRDIQTDLFYDYRTNVASYPRWQQWLRDTKPPLLVVWGRYDPSFEVAEAEAYRRDVPDAEVHVIDAAISRSTRRPTRLPSSAVDFSTRSVGEHAGALHRRRDEFEVDAAVLARQMVGVVRAAVGDGADQLFVFAQSA